MVYSSLEKLLAKFPYFLKKTPDSNFYKSESVFNEQFKELYNDLFEVYQSFHLGKRLFVWKEQSKPYIYSINFIANFPYLKRVTLYKNDQVIYNESYDYIDEVNTFVYSYDGVANIPNGYMVDEDDESYMINGDGERVLIDTAKIIPDDRFKITLETWEEYSITKGYPENNIIEGNEYDYDESLDAIGALHNIPRKTYNTLSDDELTLMSESDIITYYRKTEPQFNNQPIEDDYHYMNRIIQYAEYRHNTPLPVLEIWKLYGFPIDEISFINRERYLCKMFDETRHLDENDEYNESWEPKPWEHKDLMCTSEKEDIFFFVNVNNSSPIEGQTINFSFNFFNEFARSSDKHFFIIPYINGERYGDKYIDDSTWNISTTDFSDIESTYQFDFTFRAYEKLSDMKTENENYIESDVIRVIIKGCDNADIYVDCVDGDDKNTGEDNNNPLKTITEAIKRIHGSNNVIVLMNKNEPFVIEDVLKIEDSCSIISCSAGAVIYQENGWEIFRIMQDTNLYLQNITLKHKCCELKADTTNFSNENLLNYPFTVSIPKWVCKIDTKITMPKTVYNIYAHTSILADGELLTEKDEPVKDEEIQLYNDEALIETVTTGDDGDYSFNQRFDELGEFNYQVKHLESQNYCNSEENYMVIVEAMPTNLTAITSDKYFIGEEITIPYTLTDYYDNNLSIGELKLYEDNTLIKTIKTDEKLSFTPKGLGKHQYKLVYSHDETYIDSTFEFNINIVKYQTRLELNYDGKITYTTDETITFTGYLTDETDKKLINTPVKVYDDDSLITTLTTDRNGAITFNPELNLGVHHIQFKYEGDNKYTECESETYTLSITKPSYIIKDSTNGPWDINILDELPADRSTFSDEDYIILTDETDGTQNKLIITDNPDYDTSELSDEDILIIDTIDNPDIIIEGDDK